MWNGSFRYRHTRMAELLVHKTMTERLSVKRNKIFLG